MKGLICAGGSATRLAELTRVANKHLLPVGSWPMVYYPLQLLQRLGVREVLLVTGQQHAGQFIDLLAQLDPSVEVRGDDRFVDSGEVVTAAGVSAGIDMALHLVARLESTERAREVRRYIQYDPAPPV